MFLRHVLHNYCKIVHFYRLVFELIKPSSLTYFKESDEEQDSNNNDHVIKCNDSSCIHFSNLSKRFWILWWPFNRFKPVISCYIFLLCFDSFEWFSLKLAFPLANITINTYTFAFFIFGILTLNNTLNIILLNRNWSSKVIFGNLNVFNSVIKG